jgi:hypothetical protein
LSLIRLRLLLAALAVVLFTGSARAQPIYHAIGAGVAASCGTWTANRADRRKEPDWLHEVSWVLGFLSGAGYMGTREGFDPLRGVDAAAVQAWLDNYCRVHPLENLADAAGAFIREHPH